MNKVIWLIVTAVVCGISVAGVSAYAYNKGKQSGMHEVQTLWQSEKATLFSLLRATEQRMETQQLRAREHAQLREKAFMEDLLAARATSDRLRQQLTNAYAHIPEAPRASVDEYAVTVSQLFEQCTENYRDMAAKADGHANDVRLLQESWPVNENTGK